MKNIFKILEGLGIEVPEDKKSTLEKEVHENYRTKKDYDDQVEKAESTQKLLDETADKLKKFDGVDVADLQEKLKETTETLENERADRKKKEEEAERHTTVTEYLKEKRFVNDITRNAITAELEKKLAMIQPKENQWMTFLTQWSKIPKEKTFQTFWYRNRQRMMQIMQQFSRSRWETRQTQELREIQITWISKRTKNGESRIAKRGE